MSIFCSLVTEDCNIFRSQSKVKTLESASQLPYRHMMRHEYTTVLQRESNDPTFVREQGRWKSNAMMNNVYDSGASRSASVLENM